MAEAGQGGLPFEGQVADASKEQVSSSLPSSQSTSESTPVQVPVSVSPSPASDYVGIRDALKDYGLGEMAGQFQDDRAVLQHLALAYRQAQEQNELARYGQEVVPHWDKFQQYLKTQEQAAGQARQEPWYGKWWKPPEYDPGWDKLIQKNAATGQLEAVAGAPPDVVAKYLTHQQFRSQQAEKFLSNPFQYFEEPMRMIAENVARQVVEQNLGGYQENVSAKQFVDGNADWLFSKDQEGNRTGLTQWGQLFSQYVTQAERIGIKSIDSQKEFALGLVQRDYLGMLHQQNNAGAAAAAQGAEQKQVFLQQAAARGNAGTAAAAAVGTPQRGLSLRERMAQNFKKNGFQLSTPITGQQ